MKIHENSWNFRNWINDSFSNHDFIRLLRYCEGQYPPSLDPLIKRRRDFAQLEDFNKKGGAKSAYSKLIEEERAQEEAGEKVEKKKKKKKKNAEL